jgi:hypothetical protein
VPALSKAVRAQCPLQRGGTLRCTLQNGDSQITLLAVFARRQHRLPRRYSCHDECGCAPRTSSAIKSTSLCPNISSLLPSLPSPARLCAAAKTSTTTGTKGGRPNQACQLHNRHASRQVKSDCRHISTHTQGGQTSVSAFSNSNNRSGKTVFIVVGPPRQFACIRSWREHGTQRPPGRVGGSRASKHLCCFERRNGGRQTPQLL